MRSLPSSLPTSDSSPLLPAAERIRLAGRCPRARGRHHPTDTRYDPRDRHTTSAGQVNARIRGIFSSLMRSASDQSCKLAALAPIAPQSAAFTLSMTKS